MEDTFSVAELLQMKTRQEQSMRLLESLQSGKISEAKKGLTEDKIRLAIQHLKDINAVLLARTGKGA
jgi:hypothetical protein